MGFFHKKKKWEPLRCRPGAVIQVMEECVRIDAPIMELVLEYENTTHKVGISSDYERGRGFFDLEYYFDDQIYFSMKEWKEKAHINGRKFGELDAVWVLENEEGRDPRSIPLLAENEIA